MKPVSPIALENILRNIILKLPENIELIMGANINNIHL
jgi:hypothetical protein